MKKDRRIFLLLWLIQCLIGFLILLSFAVVTIKGINVSQYISTLVMGVIFFVMGIVGIVKWHKNK